MYSLTREDAADILGVTTRSIDRYVKSGKLRSEKDGKVVYINEDDVETIKTGGKAKQEVITPNKTEKMTPKSTIKTDSKAVSKEINNIYEDLKWEIKEKDKRISELSFKLGKMEEIAKNSISMIEFKKSQFLLEESKQSIEKELTQAKKDRDDLEWKYKDEKNANITLILVSIILLILMVLLWYSKV